MEDIAMSKQMIIRLTTRIEDLEKKLEEKQTIANFKEHSGSGEENANAADEVMIPMRPHLIQATQPSLPLQRVGNKGRKTKIGTGMARLYQRWEQ